jgi:hypothetical protein
MVVAILLAQSFDFEISSVHVLDAWHTRILAVSSLLLLVGLLVSIAVAVGRRGMALNAISTPRSVTWLHVIACATTVAYAVSAAIERVVTERALFAAARQAKADGFAIVRSAVDRRLYSHLGLAVAVLAIAALSIAAWRSLARRAARAM